MLTKLFNKITLRNHFENKAVAEISKYQKIYAQQYLYAVNTYLKSHKLKVQKTENLNLVDCRIDHTLIIVEGQSFIMNNIMTASRIEAVRSSAEKDET